LFIIDAAVSEVKIDWIKRVSFSCGTFSLLKEHPTIKNSGNAIKNRFLMVKLLQ
jgi:hypothetical protein